MVTHVVLVRLVEEFAGRPPKMDKMRNIHYSTVRTKNGKEKSGQRNCKTYHQTKFRHHTINNVYFVKNNEVTSIKNNKATSIISA